ncbi:MAG: chemotaxis protein CheW [Thermodesulfobacteriota bacterium]
MSRQIAVFRLGNRTFGMDILLVKEVHRHIMVDPVPGAPPHLAGLMNLRGRVVTVIDPGVSLGLDRKGVEDSRQMLILKTAEEIQPFVRDGRLDRMEPGEDIVGLLIDGMEDVLTAAESEMLPRPPHLTGLDGDLIRGVIKRGEDLVMLLNIEMLLDRVMQAIN